MSEGRYETEQSWLTAATKGIRFKSDRMEVERELRGHIEDKMADLRRLYPDLAQEEAEKLALGRMGDPEEIGRELAKIHRPWLGWLWRCSQMLLAGMLTVLVVVIGFRVKETWEAWQFLGGRQAVLEQAEQTVQGRAVAQVSESERIRIGDFTVSIPSGILWERETGERELYLVVRMSAPRFWEKAWMEKDGITLTDSLGKQYSLDGGKQENGTWSSACYQARTGLFHTDCVLILRDFEESAQWVRLDYEYLGQGFVLTAWLEEAELE